MNHCFDQAIPPRIGVEVEKWDLMGKNLDPSIVPLSVADMEATYFLEKSGEHTLR